LRLRPEGDVEPRLERAGRRRALSAGGFFFSGLSFIGPAIPMLSLMKRINHSEAYSMDGANTNQEEEFFSRLRRAEIGHHHHIAGDYLFRNAQEASWREDNRRVPNGDQMRRVATLAMGNKPSVDFSGYWQRHLHAS
jgi:hypothetical protein